MTHNELISIKESIETIEKFQENFPKKIVCNDVRWQAFFDWEARLCFRRRNEIECGVMREKSGDNEQSTLLFG